MRQRESLLTAMHAVCHHWDCCAGVHFGALATLFLKKARLVIHLSVNHLQKLVLCPKNLACFGSVATAAVSLPLLCVCVDAVVS